MPNPFNISLLYLVRFQPNPAAFLGETLLRVSGQPVPPQGITNGVSDGAPRQSQKMSGLKLVSKAFDQYPFSLPRFGSGSGKIRNSPHTLSYHLGCVTRLFLVWVILTNSLTAVYYLYTCKDVNQC